jgi:hypothetical protein
MVVSRLIAGLILASAAVGSSASFAAANGCDTGRWPVSPTVAKFNAALPTLASGDSLPALGAPVMVNLAPQGDVSFAHAPARQGKANPAYAAVLKLGPEPAATYQVIASTGAWIDIAENNDLTRSAGYERVQDCPGVSKVVRFRTAGGALILQISGSYGKTIKLAVERVE